LSICESLEDAIKDEEKGEIEYSILSRRFRETKRPDLAIHLQRMAEDERRHKKTLEQIKKILCPTKV